MPHFSKFTSTLKTVEGLLRARQLRSEVGGGPFLEIMSRSACQYSIGFPVLQTSHLMSPSVVVHIWGGRNVCLLNG